jgi:hypothetical protein
MTSLKLLEMAEEIVTTFAPAAKWLDIELKIIEQDDSVIIEGRKYGQRVCVQCGVPMDLPMTGLYDGGYPGPIKPKYGTLIIVTCPLCEKKGEALAKKLGVPYGAS